MDGVFSVDWGDLITALALVLIIEGILPFAHPPTMRSCSQKLSEFSDSSLRLGGFLALLSGLVLLFLAR